MEREADWISLLLFIAQLKIEDNGVCNKEQVKALHNEIYKLIMLSCYYVK